MNNEEKILQMLTKLTDDVAGLKGDVAGLKGDVAELKATQAQQGERLDEMQETLTRVAVTQEGVVLPRIQLALEGHSELKREISTLATKEQVEELASDISVIKTVVSSHSAEIGKLKRAQ